MTLNLIPQGPEVCSVASFDIALELYDNDLIIFLND